MRTQVFKLNTNIFQSMVKTSSIGLTYRITKGKYPTQHGFAEHCGRYDDFAKILVEDDYAAFRFDLRGHGRSDGKRGHIFAFEEYLQDFFCFKEKALAHQKAADKTILIGHSYGGLVSLSACLRDQSDLDAVVLYSPFFGVAEDIPKLKVGLGKLLSKYYQQLA